MAGNDNDIVYEECFSDDTDDDSDNLTMMVVMKMIMSALVIMMAIDGDIVVWVIIMK